MIFKVNNYVNEIKKHHETYTLLKKIKYEKSAQKEIENVSK